MRRIRSTATCPTFRQQAPVLGQLCLSAILLGACSNCDELEALDEWQAVIVGQAMAATPESELRAPPSPPDCTVAGAAKPSPASGAPGAYADPNLLEVARLEIERDCYKEAEEAARRRLKTIQGSTKEAR